MKITVLDGYTLNPGDISWEAFKTLGEITVYDRTPEELVVDRIGDSAAILVNKVPITAAVMDKAKNLKYIGVLATGYNVIDTEAAKQRGIVVTNIPTYGTTAVAQYVFALILELCHHVGHHSQRVKEGAWGSNPDWCFWDYPLIELYGKTMGIVGLGRIGFATAKIAMSFGMKVVAFDSYENSQCIEAGIKYVSLDELLSSSDVVSLHCPLFPSTRGIINRDSISRMKKGVLLINTSRGPLINEKDLYEALKEGRVGGAALDVLSVEPPKEKNILTTLDNCIVTPHIAWAPKESRARLMNIAFENLKSFAEGNLVNSVIK